MKVQLLISRWHIVLTYKCDNSNSQYQQQWIECPPADLQLKRWVSALISPGSPGHFCDKFCINLQFSDTSKKKLPYLPSISFYIYIPYPSLSIYHIPRWWFWLVSFSGFGAICLGQIHSPSWKPALISYIPKFYYIPATSNTCKSQREIDVPIKNGGSFHMGVDQYLLIPFLGGWTSIYQLFWCSPGVQCFDRLPYVK